MAQIESIYAPEVESQLKRIYTEIERHQKIIVETSKLSKSFVNGKTATTPNDFNKIEQEKKKQELQNERLRQSEERLALSSKKLEQAKEREIQKLQASQNLYNKTQQQINKIQSAYNELAVKKERYNNLTAFEENRLKTLQATTEKYNTTLRAVDGTVGKFSRNVGNYGSNFSPLSNSINQLTREMPAFTYSVQTGFMALSNNIPIFTDAIQQAVQQNKQLVAQGQPTKSVLSQLAGAFLSWGTALSVGVTLLTVYGKEIGDFIGKLFKTSNAVQTVAIQLESLSEARVKASENASKEISELDRLYKVANDVTISINDRKEAVDKLQALYPNYLANINDENILNGKAEKQYYKLRDAILAKYTAEAIGEQLAINSKERLDDFMDLQQNLINSEKDLQNELNKNHGYRKKYLNFDINGKAISIKQGYAELPAMRLVASALSTRIYNEQKLLEHKKQALKEDSLLIRTQNELLNQSKDLVIKNKKETDETEKNTKATKESTKATKERVKALERVQAVEKIKLTNEDPKKEFFNKEIEALQEKLRLLKQEVDLQKELFDIEQARQDWLAQFKQSFVDTFKDNSGFSKMFDLLTEGLEKYKGDSIATALAISDAFQQAFNTISSMSQANFDVERQRNEDKYNLAMKFANGNAEAEAELSKEKERREKQIARREAQQRKKLAMFNIAVDTAQAIMAVAGKGRLWETIAVAALGAAQLAMVASQEVPEFYKGTENAPEGWAKTDEKGAEIHTDKKGNIKDFGSNKGARLKYLQKGDKILTAEKTKELLFKNQSLETNSNFVNINLSGVENKLDKLINKSEFTIVKDANGERIFEKNNGMIKELKNNRLNLKPRYVRA